MQYPVSILEQFHRENGKYVLGLDEQMIYFANGAKRDKHPEGQLWELSDLTLYQQLQNKIAYYEVHLQRAETDFEDTRRDFMEEAAYAARDGYSMSTSEKEVSEQLGAKQKRVRELRKTIRKLEEQMAATSEGRTQARREERQAQAQAESEGRRCQIQRAIHRFRI